MNTRPVPGLFVTLAAAAAVTILVGGAGQPVATALPVRDVRGERPLARQILTLPPAAGGHRASFGPDGYLDVLNLAFQNPPQQPTNPTIFVSSSRDRRHWRGPATFPPPHGADQPDRPWLVPDPYRPGRVYVSNSEGAGNVVLWTSTDRGRTFSGPVLVTGA